jgi:hypothetical protein
VPLAFRTFIVVVLGCAASFLVAAPASAHDGNASNSVVHACVAKEGGVRIVGVDGTCKKNETAVHWNIGGSPGPAGSGLRVVDSNGLVVGPLVGTHEVVIPFAGSQFLVEIFRFRFTFSRLEEGQLTRFFETSDCTGTPYLLSTLSTGEFFERFSVTNDFSTLLYSDVSLGQERQLRSHSSQPNQPGSCVQEIVTAFATPVSTAPVSNFGFVPPFRVE